MSERAQFPGTRTYPDGNDQRYERWSPQRPTTQTVYKFQLYLISPCFHPDFDKISPRFRLVFTLISPRFHPSFTSFSPRFHLVFTPISTRFHPDFDTISPRFRHDFTPIFTRFNVRFHQVFTWISPRFRQDFTSISPGFHLDFTSMHLRSGSFISTGECFPLGLIDRWNKNHFLGYFSYFLVEMGDFRHKTT